MDENNTESTGAQGSESAIAGPAIGAGIIVVLLLAGALYFWSQNASREQAQLPFIEGDSQSAEEKVAGEQWMPQSTNSDEAAAIQAELEATNMNAFEAGMSADAEATNSQL